MCNCIANFVPGNREFYRWMKAIFQLRYWKIVFVLFVKLNNIGFMLHFSTTKMKIPDLPDSSQATWPPYEVAASNLCFNLFTFYLFFKGNRGRVRAPLSSRVLTTTRSSWRYFILFFTLTNDICCKILVSSQKLTKIMQHQSFNI